MTDPVAITEKDGVHKEWYEQVHAKSMNLETLPTFINHVLTDYQHDYGTICHAIAAAMTATLWAMDRAPQGGITGFQAGCIKWEVLQHAFSVRPPCALLEYENMLYPQYESKFTSISRGCFEAVQKIAQDRLKERSAHMHPDVRRHMESVAEGVVPFGLKLED